MEIQPPRLKTQPYHTPKTSNARCPPIPHHPPKPFLPPAAKPLRPIEARFEQVRAAILAHAAFFVDYGFVEATWRTYRGHRLGPYFRVRCRQRSGRHAVGSGAVPRTTSIYLGRSPELAARVRNLLDDLQQYTRGKRRCEELRRQLRRSLTREKQELRRLLAQRGAVWTWFERRPQAPGKKT